MSDPVRTYLHFKKREKEAVSAANWSPHQEMGFLVIWRRPPNLLNVRALLKQCWIPIKEWSAGFSFGKKHVQNFATRPSSCVHMQVQNTSYLVVNNLQTFVHLLLIMLTISMFAGTNITPFFSLSILVPVLFPIFDVITLVVFASPKACMIANN